MKIGEIKSRVLEHGETKDYLFDDNICPECGYNIKNIIPHNISEIGTFYISYGRKVELNCPECHCKFEKVIIDRKEKRKIEDIDIDEDNIFFIGVITGIISFILIFVFLSLGWEILLIIDIIVFLSSFIMSIMVL